MHSFEICLPGTGRGVADAAHVISMQFVGMRDKITFTFTTGNELHHARIEEAYEKPGPGDAQHSLAFFDALNLIEVQSIRRDQGLHTLDPGILDQKLVYPHEQG